MEKILLWSHHETNVGDYVDCPAAPFQAGAFCFQQQAAQETMDIFCYRDVALQMLLDSSSQHPWLLPTLARVDGSWSIKTELGRFQISLSVLVMPVTWRLEESCPRTYGYFTNLPCSFSLHFSKEKPLPHIFFPSGFCIRLWDLVFYSLTEIFGHFNALKSFKIQGDKWNNLTVELCLLLSPTS